MKTLRLPRMSTDKPFRNYRHKENGECTNHLQQEFYQKCPNIVWASDFTYIKVASKWYYLRIVMDLFSRKVISWNISPKSDVDLVMTAFKKAYEKRTHPQGLMFHSERGHSTQPFHSGSYWILLMLYNHFQRKVIFSIMPAVNISSNISKRKKPIVESTTPCRNCNYPCLSILKDSTIPKDHMALLEC